MTGSEVERLALRREDLEHWGSSHPRHRNWPVVYTLDNDRQVYVGETLNASARLHQHLMGPTKGHLDTARVIVNDTFNKSACLDLESLLIRLFAGDGKYEVLNRNDGITDADYFDRDRYREQFESIFQSLREEGLFRGSIVEIENSDLFKLSPFKALNEDQTAAVLDITEGLLEDLSEKRVSLSVVEGQPGTGKTVVAVFLMKLLRDIAKWQETEDQVADSPFAELFDAESAALLSGRRIGLVVPQQSLRTTVRNVFKRTAGLSADLVVSPFEVGESQERWDLLIVDETHRLGRRANQASGVQNRKFRSITTRLYGQDDLNRTQLDWIRAQSDHQMFLVDAAQSVRPGDLSPETLRLLREEAQQKSRRYQLRSQMRLNTEADYLTHVEALLEGTDVEQFDNPTYELRLFGNLADMRAAISFKDAEYGLSRLVAGYAWAWRSRKQPEQFDIELDGVGLRWNSSATDWIASAKSSEEVGSIHTVQGYDLNYAGVIIGEDLRFDPASGRTYADRSRYADIKGKENNPTLGLVVSDEELTRYIRNIYRVLMTRGIRGTYVYVCDPALRAHLARHLRPANVLA